MPAKNHDLHGAAPDQSKTVLLIVDVLNELKFPEGKSLLRQALPMAKKLAAFKKHVKKKNMAVVYANDNFGRWRSDRNQVLLQCLKSKCLGRPIAEILLPEEDDYFILKPKHSAFFATTLDTLLSYLGAERLIVTGIAGNLCVYHTALDAHIRDYHLIVPSDCTASNTKADNRLALKQLGTVLRADIRSSTALIRTASF